MGARRQDEPSSPRNDVTLFLCGDVMLGRGIDQILPQPSDPRLYEPYVASAEEYLRLAEDAHGAIRRPVDYAYVWGDALAALSHAGPAARIVNLETSITQNAEPAPKGINYRMHPANVPCLSAAGIDCCVLANNHVLDWGEPGLIETLASLDGARIGHAGAGRNFAEAQAPAVIALASGGRALVFGLGHSSSGIPPEWAAQAERPGVALLDGLSQRTVSDLAERVEAVRRPGDLLIASVHWGGNWGYDIPRAQRRFAQRLIEAGFDIVHGHSSHHAKAIEVHRGKLVLYGCGDFLDDYEGISGYEAFRSDLTLAYLPRLSGSDGMLIGLTMIPFRIRRFRLELAPRADAAWLRGMLDRQCGRFGAGVTIDADGNLALRWR